MGSLVAKRSPAKMRAKRRAKKGTLPKEGQFGDYGLN